MREELGADRHGIRGVGVGLDGEEFGYEKLATSAKGKAGGEETLEASGYLSGVYAGGGNGGIVHADCRCRLVRNERGV